MRSRLHCAALVLALTWQLTAAVVVDYASAAQLQRPQEYTRLVALTATQAVAELCTGRLTSVQYATALLLRASETQCLNAWAALQPGTVLAEAAAVDAARSRGEVMRPLCGLPIALKDVLDAAGYPTVAGTPALEGKVPPAALESNLVRKLRSAGGVILGKLRMHELGGGDTTISPVYGPTLNPFNVTHTVGGSSGGNGAALAAHAAVIALCADSGGSCRSPASMTATVGFRPSIGCFDAQPGVISHGALRDTVGVSARTVADVQLLNAVLSDCQPSTTPPAKASLKGLRIGKPNTWWRDVGVESLPALNAAISAMQAAGATIVDVDADPLMAFYHANLTDRIIYAVEIPAATATYLARRSYNTSLQELNARIGTTSTREWYASFVADPPPAQQYYTALQYGVPALKAAWARLFDDASLSAIVLPTTPVPSRPISDVEPMLDLNGLRRPFYDVQGRAFMADCVAGIPGISINAGVSTPVGPYPGGMPVGLMLQTRAKADADLLALANAVEAVLPQPPQALSSHDALPPCAGCSARLGWAAVAYPPSIVAPADAGSGSMAYAEDGYALDFEGSCKVKDESGITWPMVSPYAVKGATVDWSSRAGVWAPADAAEHTGSARRDEL